jgi:transient receptor potential cation channel subfamily M protein 2
MDVYIIFRRNSTSKNPICFVWRMYLVFNKIMSMEFETLSGKIMGYFSIFWNKLDMLSVILFYLAIILRYIPSSDCFCGARIILAVDLSMWFIRTLDLFSAVKQLGPKLVMIGEMVNKIV